MGTRRQLSTQIRATVQAYFYNFLIQNWDLGKKRFSLAFLGSKRLKAAPYDERK